MGSLMENVFDLLDKQDYESAIALVNENLTKRDKQFIEDLVPSLNIITSSSVGVVERIMTNLLGILNFDDDVIRYSIIISLKKFVEEHKELIFPYIEDYLKYGSPKKREGMLLLLKYVADSDPKSLQPFYEEIVSRIADLEDYVRKNAVAVLKICGKNDRREIETLLLKKIKELEEEKEKRELNSDIVKAADEVLSQKTDYVSMEPENEVLIQVADQVLRKDPDGYSKWAELEIARRAADEVIKEIVDVKSMDKDELEKRQREVESKAIQEQLEEDDQKLALEKLELEKEQRRIEQERLQQEKERLVKEKELIEKRKELDQVKQELELKRIEEEKAQLLKEEAERIQKKIELLEKEAAKDDFEEFE